jgi:hypothetical protein
MYPCNPSGWEAKAGGSQVKKSSLGAEEERREGGSQQGKERKRERRKGGRKEGDRKEFRIKGRNMHY